MPDENIVNVPGQAPQTQQIMAGPQNTQSAQTIANVPGVSTQNVPTPSQQPQDNRSNFSDFFASMWKSKPTAGPSVSPPAQSAQVPAPQVSTLTSQQQLQTAMAQLGIAAPPAFSSEDQQKMQSGDFSPLQNMMASVQQQTFVAALKAAKTLAAQEAAHQSKQSVQDARGYYDGIMAQQALQREIPVASDPMFGPPLESVMSRALQAGFDQQHAIAATKEWCNALFKAMQPTMQGANSALGGTPFASQSGDDYWKTLLQQAGDGSQF